MDFAEQLRRQMRIDHLPYEPYEGNATPED